MNQKLATIFAFAFLIGVGIFNLAAGISYIRKRNRSHFVGTFRLILSVVLFIAAFLLYKQLYSNE